VLPASFPPTVPCSGSALAPAGPSDQFPAFFATTRCSDSLLPLPPRFVSFAWRYRPRAVGSLPPRAAPPRQAWAVLRERPLTSSGGGSRASQVPGVPQFQRAPLYDPGETYAPGHCGASVLPSALPTASALTTCAFRSSITRPAGSLCTLRSLGYPSTTQHSVPAAGQLCRTGFPPAGDKRKVSVLATYFLLTQA
jgi:hypothetical protein